MTNEYDIWREKSNKYLLFLPTILAPMDQAVLNGSMSYRHVSYVTLHMQIIHLFTIPLARSLGFLRLHVQHLTAAYLYLRLHTVAE